VNCEACKFWLPNGPPHPLWGTCDIKLPPHLMRLMEKLGEDAAVTRCDDSCDLGQPETPNPQPQEQKT
jgi:hypothetical protein